LRGANAEARSVATIARSSELTASPAIAVEEFEVAAAYDDPRIVYRTGPFHLRYYHYHRWSAPPSIAIRDYFRAALGQTRHFARVTSQASDPSVALIVGGTVHEIEEVDVSEERWVAHVSLQAHARSAATGLVLWSRTFEANHTLEQRHPEALARAMSTALDGILSQLVPTLHELARRESDTKEHGTDD
jgi:ABC-type uncharacterized transport system auxiliary subunit